MNTTRTAGLSSIVIVLIGAAAIGAGALMSNGQGQSPGNMAVSTSTDASSTVAIAVEEEGVKRTVRSEAEAGIAVEEEGVEQTVKDKEASIASEALDDDDDGDAVPTVKEESLTVTYSTDGFSPQTLNVSVGTTVTFENSSNSEMWVATENSSCDANEGKVFNQCEAGSKFSFTFKEAGEFSYQNQQNTEHRGVVIVSQE